MSYSASADFIVREGSNGHRVRDTHLGINFLYGLDDPQGDWLRRGLKVGMKMARWPGGSIAESDPSFLEHYIEEAHRRDWTRLDDPSPGALHKFLKAVGSHNIKPTIVIPVRRYLEGREDPDFKQAERELGAFIDAVMAYRFGSVPINVWELGNEFMFGRPRIDPELYGSFCVWLANLLRKKAVYPIQIGIQGANWTRGGLTRLARSISETDKKSFDFLIHHSYVRELGKANHRGILRDYRRTWGQIPVYFSEWNAKSDRDTPNAMMSYGMKQASVMAHMFADIIKHNVRYAALWPLQQNNKTSAFAAEGRGLDTPYVAGAVFRWLSDLLGYQQYDVSRTHCSTTCLWAYGACGKLTILVATNDEAERTITVELPFRPASVSAERMYGSRNTPRSCPRITPMDVEGSGNVLLFRGNVEGPNELLRIRTLI